MASTDARPVPKKNVAYRHYFAIRKNDGTLITTWAGQDSEVSLDAAGFGDCANEATEDSTSGCGYIDLTSDEMNADEVTLKVTVTNTDALPYVVFLFPEETGDIRADATQIGGTTQTGRDIGASVLLSPGTGTGQLSISSGVVKSNLSEILGTALTETSGYIAAAFKKMFNVATPLLMADEAMRGTDGAFTGNMSSIPLNAGTGVKCRVADGFTLIEGDEGLTDYTETYQDSEMGYHAIGDTGSDVSGYYTFSIGAGNVPSFVSLQIRLNASAGSVEIASYNGSKTTIKYFEYDELLSFKTVALPITQDMVVGNTVRVYIDAYNLAGSKVVEIARLVLGYSEAMRGTDGAALASAYTADRAAKLDNLDATVSSRGTANAGDSMVASNMRGTDSAALANDMRFGTGLPIAHAYGFGLTEGDEGGSDYESTFETDGNTHDIIDDGSGIDGYYQFYSNAVESIDGVPVSLKIIGSLSGGATKTLSISQWDFVTSSWNVRGSIAGTSSAAKLERNFSLVPDYVSDGKEIRIRVYTADTDCTLYVDEISVSLLPVFATQAKQDTAKAVIDTIAGDVVNIDGAAMRGTDGAALASVCTEARISELAALNLPLDISKLTTDVGNLYLKLIAYVQLITRKDADVAAMLPFELADINADLGGGAGTYDNTTDSQEAIRDTAPLGTTMRGTDGAALASAYTSDRATKLDNLDATVSSRGTANAGDSMVASNMRGTDNAALAASYTADRAAKLDNLDASVSSRSSFDSASDQVKVTQNNDKTGYSLAADQSVNITKVNGLSLINGSNLATVLKELHIKHLGDTTGTDLDTGEATFLDFEGNSYMVIKIDPTTKNRTKT